MAPTIEELLKQARRQLAAAPFRPSTREAALLLGRVLGLGEAQVLARPAAIVSGLEVARFQAVLERRLRGEPVAYLVGEKEFFGRPFRVDPRVLIPRPESEHLIEVALGQARPRQPRILDIGTGCGCLAITLALEIQSARCTATDLSPAALAVAAANAHRHGVARRVALTAADLCRGLDLEPFDLVVSNPPYVDPAGARELSPEILRHEPSRALFGGLQGRAILDRLLRELEPLRAGVRLIVEIGFDQDPWIRRRATASSFRLEAIQPDYAGHPRIVVLKRR